MNVQFTVSAESFSLDPEKPVYVTNGNQMTLKRLDKFNDNLEFRTPDDQPHAITKGHIYILENFAYECHEDTTNRNVFGIRLFSSLPPLDMDGIEKWQMRYPPLQQPPNLSDYALKVQSYALQHRKEYPNANNDTCINTAVVKMVAEYGHDKHHLGDIALSELAALWIFRATH